MNHDLKEDICTIIMYKNFDHVDNLEDFEIVYQVQ